MDLRPCKKRDSAIFYSLTLQHFYPPPVVAIDLWYNFGFCTCTSDHEQRRLGGLYSCLIGGSKFHVDYSKSTGSEYIGPEDHPKATFDEFWRAYESGQHIQLMDQYGLQQERLEFRGLEQFLKLALASLVRQCGGSVIIWHSKSQIWACQNRLWLELNFMGSHQSSVPV
jgi:hypothetical protein